MAEFLKNQIQQSQSSESIKEETIKILDEAKEIRARLDNDEAQKEYDEVRLSTIAALKDLQVNTHDDFEQLRADLGNGNIDPFTYSQGEITQNELGDITKEFSDLRQLENNGQEDEGIQIDEEDDLGMLGGFLFSRIQATNDKILLGGETELQEQLAWYSYALGGNTGEASPSGLIALGLAKTNIEENKMIEYAGKISALQNSNEDLYTKMFQLSRVLYNVTQEGGAPQGLEDAHNLATRNIIQRIIENGETQTLAVGFNESNGYFTSENITSTSSELEVGTYLGSLNKSGNLNKETLLSIFNPTELFIVLERYKSGEFQDPNINSLFTQERYLDGFEENMENIIKEVLETESDPVELLNIIDSTSSSPGFIGPILPDDLYERTYNIDLDTLQNPVAKDTIMSERNAKFTDTALTYQENILTSLGSIYDESPEIMLFLERSLSINGANQNNFDIDAIETLITEHNNSHPERPLPSLQTSELSNILNAVNALRDVNLSIKFDESMNQIIQLQEEIDNIHIELESSRQALIITQEEGNQEAIDAARNESIMQQRASYGAARASADATRRVNEANNEAGQEIQAAMAHGDSSALENIRENNELSENDKEILSQLMLEAQSYLDEKHGTLQEALKELIPEGASPEEESAFIDALTLYFHKYTIDEVMENPQIRLSKITNKDILLQLLTEYNTDDKLIDTNFKNLPQSLRNNKEIALAFPGKIAEDDFPFMQPSLLSDSNFIRSVISKSINRRNEEVGVNKENLGLLLQRYCASGGDTRTMAIILGEMFQVYPEFKSEMKDKIPYAILNSDSEGVLDIDISSLSIGPDIIIGILNGLGDTQGPNDFENRFIPAFKNADKILERNPGNTELKLLIIEKGGLANTTYLRGNLGFDRSSATWEHVLKHDINSIRFLEEGTRKNSYFQQKFVEHLDESVVRENGEGDIILGHLLQYIPLDSPIEIFNFMNLLKTKFPQTFGGGENGDFSENVYRFIGTNERFRNTITTYFNTYGIDGLDDELDKDKIIIFLHNSISHSSQLYKDIQTMQVGFESFAEIDSHFDELLKQELLDALGIEEGESLDRAAEILINSKSGILEENTAELLRIIGPENMGDLLVIYNDISTRRSNSQDAFTGAEEQDPANFNDNFLPFLMENDEGNMVMNIDKIKENLYILIRSNYIGDRYGFNDFTLEFLESEFGLEGDKLSKVSQLILNRFNEEQRGQQIEDATGEDGKVTEVFLETMRTGTVGERADLAFQQQQEEIFQTYKGITLDEDGNITVPSESQQNLNPSEIGLDTRDTYREISSELMLTPEEQSSLTTEELNAIASSESVRESFIGFRSTLIELGLTELWKFRNDIFKAIGSLNFNVADGDYIGENEFNIFLAETVYATTQDSRLKPIPSNIENTKELVRQINKQSGGISDVDNVNSVGEAMTLVENNFREKFAPKNSGVISFKISEFQKARRS